MQNILCDNNMFYNSMFRGMKESKLANNHIRASCLTVYVHVDNTELLTELHPKSRALLVRFGQSRDTKSKEVAAEATTGMG